MLRLSLAPNNRDKVGSGNPQMSEQNLSTVYQTLRPDGRQSETAFAVQRGVGRILHNHGFAVLTEFILVTGRRADVIGIHGDGRIWIVEIKSSAEDLKADQKWPEYRAYCDRLFFAIPLAMAQVLIPVDAGLIVADQFGAEIMRKPQEHPLAAARRKAVTLSFGRVAAQRLHTLWDP